MHAVLQKCASLGWDHMVLGWANIHTPVPQWSSNKETRVIKWLYRCQPSTRQNTKASWYAETIGRLKKVKVTQIHSRNVYCALDSPKCSRAKLTRTRTHGNFLQEDSLEFTLAKILLNRARPNSRLGQSRSKSEWVGWPMAETSVYTQKSAKKEKTTGDTATIFENQLTVSHFQTYPGSHGEIQFTMCS